MGNKTRNSKNIIIFLCGPWARRVVGVTAAAYLWHEWASRARGEESGKVRRLKNCARD